VLLNLHGLELLLGLDTRLDRVKSVLYLHPLLLFNIGSDIITITTYSNLDLLLPVLVILRMRHIQIPLESLFLLFFELFLLL
jgi:hypothetical protein